MSNFICLKEIQYRKIDYFCSKVKIENIHTAERYLNEAMWDEKLAVQNYLKKHNNIDMDIDMTNFYNNKIKEYENNQNINFQKPPPIAKNDMNNSEKVEIINENDENYIPLKITNVIDEHKYNNSPTCESLNYIKNNLKTVKLEFNYFLELTKDRIGIILIYNENTFNMILKNKIKEIKSHVLYSVLNENYVIFPVLNNSPIGKELSRQFLCISYPSCLFCEYKKKEQLCVTKRMDGTFDVSFFYSCIPFEDKKKYPNSSRNFIPKLENDNNIKEINKINNFIKKQRDYNDNYNYENLNKNNMGNNQINDNIKDKNQNIEFNNINKNNNINNNKDFKDNIKPNYKKQNTYNSQNVYQNNLDNYFMGSSTGFFDLIKQISNEQEDNPNNKKNDNNNFNNHYNYNELNNKNSNQNEMNNPNKNFNDKYDNDNNNQFINKNEKSNKNIIHNENSNKSINQNYNNKYDNYNPFINNNNNNNNINNNNFNNNNYNNNNNNNYNNNYNNNSNNYNNNNNSNYNNNYKNNNININKNDNNSPFINKNENSNINQKYNNKNDNYDPYINKNENLNQNFNNNKKNDNYVPFENEDENKDKEHNIMADSIYGLSDGQILAKRENAIKELERQQLEKEKKEEEEKQKILEEEKRIKKLNRKYEYEAKMVKLFLSKEPEEDNPDACHIKFRHPDGEKIIERRFLKTDKIASLYDYVKSIGREIFSEEDAFDFELIGGFPPKSLEDKKSNTLEEEGMFPNFILQIKEK